MKLTYFLYSVSYFAGHILITTIHSLYDNVTTLMIKYFVLAIIVPPIAIFMKFKDDAPVSKKEIALTLILAMVFVWFGYEANLELSVPTIFCLILSFVFGIFALEIILAIKKKIPALVEGTMDSFGENLKKIMSNIADTISGFFKKK